MFVEPYKFDQDDYPYRIIQNADAKRECATVCRAAGGRGSVPLTSLCVVAVLCTVRVRLEQIDCPNTGKDNEGT